MTETLTPSRIMETGMAFWPSKVLLTAMELDLFSTLADRAMTGAALRNAFGLQPVVAGISSMRWLPWDFCTGRVMGLRRCIAIQ